MSRHCLAPFKTKSFIHCELQQVRWGSKQLLNPLHGTMQNTHNMNFPGTSISNQPLTHRAKKLWLRQPHIWVFDSGCRFKIPHLVPTNLYPTSAFQQESKMNPISKRLAVPQHQIPIFVCCRTSKKNQFPPPNQSGRHLWNSNSI
jgi:hypothetical protein